MSHDNNSKHGKIKIKFRVSSIETFQKYEIFKMIHIHIFEI